MRRWGGAGRGIAAAVIGLALLGCRDRGEAAGTETATETGGESGADTEGETETDGELACEGSVAPRQLRLLTRREYDATVHDLFGLVDPDTCSDDAQCPSGATCDGSACVVETVEPTAFVIPHQLGWTTVHLAGEFNDWPGTIADGGLPLEHDPATETWTGSFEIPAGQHAYKLVINETDWIADPTNPQTEDDGFGGQNSVLEVVPALSEVPPRSLSFTEDLPLESRPEGYAFDNNAAAGLVTSVHAEQLMRAAQTVAAFAVAEPTRWLPCDPAAADCAETFAATVGRRVFRRPLSPEEVSKYADLVRGEATPDDGLRVALQAMLASPYFLYRFEVGQPEGEGFSLTAFEVATLLSYALWGTTPDEALLDAAADGRLDAEDGLREQVERLLADPRAREMVGTFAVQWLGVERLLTADKNAAMFPGFDAATRQAALDETRRLVAHVAFDGSGRYQELLTADYAFVDEGLAALYGISPPAAGEAAPLPPERAAGLLGQTAVLGSYAYSDQSSPVRRGLFVRRALLCQQLPPPPPDAGGVPEVDPDATTRERFEQHTADPVCAACHQIIDPIGFGFEHFDPVGAWRDLDAGKPIDASGEVRGVDELGGEAVPFSTVPELGRILADSEAAPACFARHYFRFTHGRLETPEDDCAIEQLTARFGQAEHDLVSLVVATLTAPELRIRR